MAGLSVPVAIRPLWSSSGHRGLFPVPKIFTTKEGTMYVIYVNYGRGVTFRTGPVHWRHRVGLWAHYYVRDHPRTCSCLRCLRRISARPVVSLPPGRVTGHMYVY